MFNRIFLVHVQTGLAVYVGTRLKQGWAWPLYRNTYSIQRLYDVVNTIQIGSRPGNLVVMEDDGSLKFGDDRDDGLVQLIMPEDA